MSTATAQKGSSDLEPRGRHTFAARKPSRKLQQDAPTAERKSASNKSATPAPSPSAVRALRSPSHPTGRGGRARTALRAQRHLGNRAVQRAARRATVQRQCACGGTCPRCRAQAAAVVPAVASLPPRYVQTKLADPPLPAAGADAAELIPAGGGRPLEPDVRASMEEGFGEDFGDVRVHTGSRAADASEALAARAFTTGRDIYFAAGQYAPATLSGQRLLAHELAHTVQQKEGRLPQDGAAMSAGSGLVVGRADDPLEHEADRAADAVVSGRRPTVSADAASAPTVRRNAVTDALGTAWDATGGRAVSWGGKQARRGYKAVKGWAVAKIEEHAPGVLEFLQTDLVELLKEKISSGVDSLFGGLASAVREKGLVAALTDAIGAVAGKVGGALSSLGGGACKAIAGIAQAVFDFARALGGEALGAFKKGASAVGAFLQNLWARFGAPAWKAIKEMAGAAWTWVSDKAKWLWKQTAWLRQKLQDAWDWLKEKFNLAWSTGASALEWLKEKAIAAWDKVKEVIRPILGPLKVAAGIFVMLSPLGPMILIWKTAPMLWDALKWLWNNWGADILLRARKALREQILPAIMGGVATVRGLLQAAGAWLTEKLGSLTAALGKLGEALGVTTFLKRAKQAVDFLAQKVSALATWVSGKLLAVLNAAGSVLAWIWSYLQPVFVVSLKLMIAIVNPLFAPIFFGAVAWRMLPDCLKPPIVDFILDLLIAVISALPDLKSFGETWAHIKGGIVEQMVALRSESTERKVLVSNKVAEFISGGDLEPYANLLNAARQSPDHLAGQMQEELIGMDLGKPLPFEKGAVPEPAAAARQNTLAAVTGGAITSADAAALTRGVHSDASIGVTSVADLDPAFLASLAMPDGGSVEFGERDDPDLTVAALQQELGLGVEGGGGGSGEGGAIPDPTLSVDEQLDQMIASQPDPPCTKEKPAEGPAQAAEIPEHMKIGPLTQGQRARYMFAQIKKGVRSWYECNRTVILASLAAALVVIIVAAIFTGGAALEALPVILEIVAAIMIGVAMIRVAAYIGAYFAQAILGDVAGAAKSLARGLAVGAVELVFALLFSLGPLIKSIKAGFTASVKAGQRAAAKVVTSTVKNFQKLGQIGLKASKNVAKNVKSLGRVFVQNGKIMMQGLGKGFSRGVRSLKDLARRLWRRLRFRKFKIVRSGRWFQLWGYINPWALLATGKFIEVHVEGRPMIGDLVDITGKRQAGVIVGVFDTLPSTAVRELQALSLVQRKALYKSLIGKTKDQIRSILLGARETAAHAKELRKSLVAAGSKAKPGEHAHHLVPSTHRMADEARKILEKFRVKINAAENGVFLSDALHSGLHTHAYIAEVTRRLRGAKNAADVRAVLDEIRRLIRAGNFP